MSLAKSWEACLMAREDLHKTSDSEKRDYLKVQEKGFESK